MRRLLLLLALLWIGLAYRPRLSGQTEKLKFEVASVKREELPPDVLVVTPEPRPLDVHGNSFEDCCYLHDFIRDAYNLKGYQISGLPHWAEEFGGDRYVISAKAAGTPTDKQWRTMLQSLLEERFELKVHSDSKELPVYALVLGKNGTKLRKARASTQPDSLTSMAEIVSLIASHLDRPVINHTGLDGPVEEPKVEWRKFGPYLTSGKVETAGDAVFLEVQEQLGLKLDPRKESTELLVIDHVAKPTAN